MSEGNGFFLKREKIVDAEALILIHWTQLEKLTPELVELQRKASGGLDNKNIFVRGGPNFGIKGQ